MRRAEVLDRYSHDALGDIIIEVSADGVEDLYNCFDKNAPHIRRDLEREFVQYLIDCATELESETFRIDIVLARATDDEGLSRITHSMNVYFQYLAGKEKQTLSRMLRKSLVLMSLGLIVLFLSVWVNQWLGVERSVVANVFGQGLTIVAWVSLWEALATFLIEWFPRRKKIALYTRLSVAPLHIKPQLSAGLPSRTSPNLAFTKANANRPSAG